MISPTGLGGLQRRRLQDLGFLAYGMLPVPELTLD